MLVNSFERKQVTEKFLELFAELDKLSDHDLEGSEAEEIRDRLDEIWHGLDSIAEIQVDPLRASTSAAANVEVVDRKVVDEGDVAKFTAKLHDLELDQWDNLDASVSWRRLDLCNPKMYDEVAAFWGIDRPQDMEEHEAYWTPKYVHES